MLQYVEGCGGALQWVAVCRTERASLSTVLIISANAVCAVCCSVVQSVAVRCSMLQYVAVCCSLLHRVAGGLVGCRAHD